MSDVNDRILRVVLWEADLAARLIQNRVRVMATKRKIATYPQEVRLRYIIGFNTISNDLNRQWRRMRASAYHEEMTSTVRGSHMQTLLQLVKPGTSKYFRSNRRRVVEMGGLIFIRAALMREGGGGNKEETLSLDANALLCELAREPSLLLFLIEAQMGTSMLRHCRANAALTDAVNTTALLTPLKTLNYMCLGAYVIAMANNTRDDASAEQQPGIWVQQCLRHGFQDESEDGDMHGKVEALEECRYSTGVATAVHAQLVTPEVVDTLVEIAQTTAVTAVLMATTRLLHSMACIDAQAERLVLDRVTQEGCRSFERILAKGLESGDVQAGAIVTALFLQLCSRLEHRDLLVGRGMVRLVPYCEGLSDSVDLDSLVSVCALRCVVGLCQGGEQVTYSPWRVAQAVSKASVPALRNELYDELYALAEPGEDSMAHALRRMKRLRLTNLVLAYLVRPVRVTLSADCHSKGGIVLYGMLAEPEVVLAAPDYLRGRTAEHLLLMVEDQTAKALSGNDWGGECQEGRGWLWLGLRAALFTLCRFTQALGAVGSQRVWEGANRHNLLPSLHGLLSAALLHEASSGTTADTAKTAPSVPQHVLEGVLRVVEHLAPVPSYDSAAEAATECMEDPKEAEDDCQPMLMRLCRIFAQPILMLLESYSCLERPPEGCMGAAFAVLARLAAIYPSCVFLKEAGVLGTLSALSMRYRYDDSDKYGHGKRLSSAVDIPPSFYHVLGALARLPLLRPPLYDAFMRHTLNRLASLRDASACDITKAHLLMLVARLAHEHTSRTGQADDWLIAPDTRVISIIVSSIQPSRGSSPLLRFWATSAAASLMRDILKAVPRFVKAGIIIPLVALAGSASTPHPLLRRVLQALSLIASHPHRAFHNELHKTQIRQCLFRVANSQALCRGPPGELPLGHLANEILIVVEKHEPGPAATADEKRGAHDTARGPLEEKERGGKAAPTTIRVGGVVHLPVQHASEPSVNSYLDVGVSTCGPLQPQGPNEANHAVARRMQMANITEGSHAESWQKRYAVLMLQQQSRGDNISVRESCVVLQEEATPLRLSRPIRSSPPRPNLRGGVRRKYPLRFDAGSASKDRHDRNEEAGDQHLLDPVFVSSSDDGSENPAAMPALSLCPPVSRQHSLTGDPIRPFHQATRFQGHVVEVRGQRGSPERP